MVFYVKGSRTVVGDLAGFFEDLLDDVELSGADFDLRKMFDCAVEDLQQLIRLIALCNNVGSNHDDKYQQLSALLLGGQRSKDKSPLIYNKVFAEHKVLVFTEFADTAKYLEKRLRADGLIDFERIDGSTKKNRLDVIRRFAPFYNKAGQYEKAPLRVLISTDVLAEGVNLQDASLIVNYDIHWNPVRLMQRIGRVDRRLNRDIENHMASKIPNVSQLRGNVHIRNFLPPDELNRLLSLYSRVESRTYLISKTLGIPGGRLLQESDMLDDVKVFNNFKKEYLGEISPIESLRLEFLELLRADADLASQLAELKAGVFSSRVSPKPGWFICTLNPSSRFNEVGVRDWSFDPGIVSWDFVSEAGAEELSETEMANLIRATKHERGDKLTNPAAAVEVLSAHVERRFAEHLRNFQMPFDVSLRPRVISWIELKK